MAYTQALPRPHSAQAGSSQDLVAILAGDLPDLPPGEAADAAADLRRMRSGHAVAVWRHPGWGQLVGWIVRSVPDCDPTLAAVHAIRNRQRAVDDPAYARSLAAYTRQVARRSPVESRPKARRIEELTWDPAEPEYEQRPSTDSLSGEASRLLSAAAIRPSETAWSLIAGGVDIAVDWWDGLATRTGMVGEELVAAARRSPQITGSQRLRANFDGPASRPLVALLVGGDQRGRWARQAAGVEAGLLYWCLLTRHLAGRGDAVSTPPPPIRRAWATHVAWIEQTATTPNVAVEPASGPTIAA